MLRERRRLLGVGDVRGSAIVTWRAPGMEAASCSPASGGATGSPSPVTTRVGASIAASRSRRSSSASASQQAGIPLGGRLDEHRAERRPRASAGARGVNQRARAASAIAATPCARTVAARSSHCSRGGRLGAVEQRTRRSTRSGASEASHMPTIPPIERPQNETRLDAELVEEVERRRAPDPRSSTGPEAPASGRGRAGRSGRAGSAPPARAPADPTSRASSRASCTAAAAGRRPARRADGAASRIDLARPPRALVERERAVDELAPPTRDRWTGRERHRARRHRGRFADRRGAHPGSSSAARRLAHDLLRLAPGRAAPSGGRRLAPPARGRRSASRFRSHPGGVDLQRLERARQRVERPAGVRERAG